MAWTNPASFYVSHTTPLVGMPIAVSGVTVQEIPIASHVWHFGEAQKPSTQLNPTYTFTKSGQYTITHIVCDHRGNTYTASQTITANHFIKPAVVFSSAVTQLTAGVPQSYIISVTAVDPHEVVVALYSSESQSIPARYPPQYFDHLIPRWGFYASDDIYFETPITQAIVEVLPITINDQIVGYRGSACVTYKDDLPGTPTLWATLSSHAQGANTRVAAGIDINIATLSPDHIKLTSDGKAPISPCQWSGGNIPVIATLNATISGQSIAVFDTASASSFNIVFESANQQLSSFYDNTITTPLTTTVSYQDANCHIVGGFSKLLLTTCTTAPVSTTLYATCTSLAISGSADIVIYPFYDANQFRVFNEDRDLGEIFKNAAPPHIQLVAPTFWDQYLPVTLGRFTDNDPTSPGVRIFERIANFTLNIGDIDLCQIPSIISKAVSRDVAIDNFNLTLPSEISRYLHYASIMKQRLWGTQCNCLDNFDQCDECCEGTICPVCGVAMTFNRGNQIDCTTYQVTAGTPFVYREIGDSVWKLARTVPLSGTTSVYPLTAIESGDFVAPLCDNYVMHTYVAPPVGNFINGLIDWDNCQTLLSPTTTTRQWNTTIIPNALNFLLHSGLQITSVTGCTIPPITCSNVDDTCY